MKTILDILVVCLVVGLIFIAFRLLKDLLSAKNKAIKATVFAAILAAIVGLLTQYEFSFHTNQNDLDTEAPSTQVKQNMVDENEIDESFDLDLGIREVS